MDKPADSPVFAISTPIGAYHDFLPSALRSLAIQRAPFQSALLDASGDERVKEIADAHDGMLAYRRHGPDGGQSAAIIEGWENTTGDILGWLNADDLLFPGALEKAVAAFEADPDLDVVCGHSIILGDRGEMTGYHWAVEPPGPRILEAGIISQPSCFFRRSAYERVGGLNEDLHYTMDWDLWIRLYKAGAKFGFIDAPLSMVLWGEGTKTASFNKARRDELRALIAEHAPAEKQKRIFQSFAIHHLLERIPAQGVRNWLSRRLSKNRTTIFGVGAEGALDADAQIHYANLGAEPREALVLMLEHPEKVTVVDAGERDIQVARHKDGILISFKQAVKDGEAIGVRLKQSGGARFRGCEWL
ncbi:MAG: glycosyltransferase [Pseudomonadota bacterium]